MGKAARKITWEGVRGWGLGTRGFWLEKAEIWSAPGRLVSVPGWQAGGMRRHFGGVLVGGRGEYAGRSAALGGGRIGLATDDNEERCYLVKWERTRRARVNLRCNVSLTDTTQPFARRIFRAAERFSQIALHRAARICYSGVVAFVIFEQQQLFTKGGSSRVVSDWFASSI